MLKETKELYQTVLANMTQKFKDNPKLEVPPHWIILAENGDIDIVITPFEGSQQKQVIANLIRMKLAADNSKAYILVSEAWTVQRNTVEEMNSKMPSECEDRVEILMLNIEDREGQYLKVFEMVRDWETGGVTELKPMFDGEDEGNKTGGGIFSNLLSEA